MGTPVLASLREVLSLWWYDSLRGFQDIWWWIFAWALVSSIIVHASAALISFCLLHKHKEGRWYTLAIIVMGVLTPITGGVLSSVVIAGMYVTLGWSMEPRIAMIWGTSQTSAIIVISFLRLLPTL